MELPILKRRHSWPVNRRQATEDWGHAAFRGEVGGFCCPVPPEPRLSLMQRQRAPHCHWHLWVSPITAVQCRAKGESLPRVSSLFRPHWPAKPVASWEMVEAPGTAPGSTTLISHTVYHHSQQA